MKKMITAVLCGCFFLAACGTGTKPAGTTEAGTQIQTQSAAETEAAEDMIPSVMVDGILYQDTGYVSSAVGCGTMDGEITSEVDGSEIPTKDGQSNFGTGYGWQRGPEGQIIVVIDGRNEIFRDPEHLFDSDIPAEVLNFRAEVLEVRAGGDLLLSFLDAPELFMPPFKAGDEINVHADKLTDTVSQGDVVRVWSDGLVQEIYPPILPNVYRIEKEDDGLCNVKSAGVLVSAAYKTPYGLTVLFDQYDSKIPEELLTGEHFALDRWTGENWSPMDTVISDYGFTDIGYPLKKGGMTRKVFNWDWLYGKLEPGRYRIRVQVIGSEVYEAAAVFTISSGDTGAAIDVGDSGLYSEQDRLDAAAVILEEISSWEGCELHQLWYTSDEQNTADNIRWMNELAEGQGLKEQFTECMQFKSNYHSPVDPDKAGGWEPDEEYTNWEWWLARADGGEWHLMTWGY